VPIPAIYKNDEHELKKSVLYFSTGEKRILQKLDVAGETWKLA